MDIEIGTKWLTRGEYPRLCEVIDIFTTRNQSGEIVKTEYQSTHKILDQEVRHVDCKTTVLMGIARMSE